MKRNCLVLFLALLCSAAGMSVVSAGTQPLAGVPQPFRIGGTVTIDGVQLTQATASGLLVKVTKLSGGDYTDANSKNPQTNSLNASNFYIIDIPNFDSSAQPGGANPGDAAKVHIFLNGVELTITSPANGQFTVGSSGAILSLNIVATTPPKGALQFSSATYNVNENGGTATITATRTGGSSGAVSVHYATSDGTAAADSDYTAASGTLNWADGDAASKIFTVPITDDTTVEGNETVNLTLSGPTGGATLGSLSTAVLTIMEPVAPALVSVPTMTEWGMIIFMLISGIGAVYFLRRRNKA